MDINWCQIFVVNFFHNYKHIEWGMGVVAPLSKKKKKKKYQSISGHKIGTFGSKIHATIVCQ